MNRIRALNLAQKCILLFLIAMIMVFSVVYPLVLSREGFLWQDTMFTVGQAGENTTYTGKFRGETAVFTVTPEKTVTFRHGEKVYGPYTVTPDASAVSAESDMAELLTGVEVRQGEQVLFRGGAGWLADLFWMEDEAGEPLLMFQVTTVKNGQEYDENGNPVDPAEPSIGVLLQLTGIAGEVELTHKGTALGWLGGVGFCLLNGCNILFADEWFRWNLRFSIREPEKAEPSDWELVGRYFLWAILAVGALVMFIMGLQG